MSRSLEEEVLRLSETMTSKLGVTCSTSRYDSFKKGRLVINCP